MYIQLLEENNIAPVSCQMVFLVAQFTTPIYFYQIVGRCMNITHPLQIVLL